MSAKSGPLDLRLSLPLDSHRRTLRQVDETNGKNSSDLNLNVPNPRRPKSSPLLGQIYNHNVSRLARAFATRSDVTRAATLATLRSLSSPRILVAWMHSSILFFLFGALMPSGLRHRLRPSSKRDVIASPSRRARPWRFFEPRLHGIPYTLNQLTKT